VNIFLTVGTTPFESLVEALDSGVYAKESLMQIADGYYKPKNSEWFRFKPSIDQQIKDADIVVCHAGAGSVFRLIQSGLLPIVVPNMERRDQHQIEIANWLDVKKYAVVAKKPEDINGLLEEYVQRRSECNAFEEKRFFNADELNSIISNRLN